MSEGRYLTIYTRIALLLGLPPVVLPIAVVQRSHHPVSTRVSVCKLPALEQTARALCLPRSGTSCDAPYILWSRDHREGVLRLPLQTTSCCLANSCHAFCAPSLLIPPPVKHPALTPQSGGVLLPCIPSIPPLYYHT